LCSSLKERRSVGQMVDVEVWLPNDLKLKQESVLEKCDLGDGSSVGQFKKSLLLKLQVLNPSLTHPLRPSDFLLSTRKR